jgi:hypothetical protein
MEVVIKALGIRERALLLPDLKNMGKIVDGANCEANIFLVPRHRLGRALEDLSLGIPSRLLLGLDRRPDGEVVGGWVGVLGSRGEDLIPEITIDSARAFTGLGDNDEIIPPFPLHAVIAHIALQAVIRDTGLIRPG